MQYALMEVDGCHFLIDGNEFQVLNGWKSKPIKEQSGFNEEAHSYFVGVNSLIKIKYIELQKI